MEENFRHFRGWMAALTKAIGVIIPLLSLAYVFNFHRIFLNVLVYASQYTALFLTLVLVLVFLLVPATKHSSRTKVSWYDVLLIILSLSGCLYIIVAFPTLYKMQRIEATILEQALYVATLVVLSEAIRRTLGWPLLIIGYIFLLHAHFAYLLPGLLGGPPYFLSDLASYIYLYQWGFFGTVLEIAATTIIIFTLFGSFLQEAGASQFFTDLALSVTGHVRGGPAKVAIVSSALFGTISGSPVANVGADGVITINMMKKIGYKAHYAGAIEAVASTGGAIMPPVMGVVAFIMAEYTKAGYAAVCKAAVLPAILYFLCLFFQVDFQAAKSGLRGLPREQLPSFAKTLKEGWQFLIPLLVLVGLVIVLQYDPLESAVYALVSLVLVSWVRKETRLGLKRIVQALENGTKGVLSIAPICAFVGTIGGSVALTGLGINLSAILVQFSGGSLLALAILAGITIYFMGMGIGVIISYIMLAIIVAPAMVKMGVPVLVAHFFIFYMGCSMFITPPNAPAIFVASSIAGSKLFQTGFAAMRLGIVCYLVPFVILYNPALLLMGKPMEIALAVVTSLLGAYFLAAGIEGYLLRQANLWERMLFALGGLCFFIPGWWIDILGLGIIALPLIRQWKKRKILFFGNNT